MARTNLFILAAASALFWCGTLAAQTSITLDEAREIGLASNEDAAIAQERIRASRGLRRQALAGMLPTVTGSLQGSYNGPAVELGGRAFTRTFDWGASVRGELRLLDLSLYPAYSAAKRGVEIAELNAEWTRQSVAFEVDLAFFELAAAERRVAIAESTVELRSAYLEQAQALAEQGIALPLDAARARAQKLEADQALLEARAALGNAADRLAILLVRPTDGELRADVAESEPLAPPGDSSGAESSSDDEQRADIAALSLEVEARDLTRSSVFWSLFPYLTLTGTSRLGQPSVPAPDGIQWSVVLALNWTLYDGGRRYGRLEQLRAETEIAQLQVNRAEREMSGAVSEALRSWRSAYDAIAVARELEEVASEAYDMAKARFDAGLATSIEVNESSDSLLRARLQRNNARLNADTAAARYRYVKGLAAASGE